MSTATTNITIPRIPLAVTPVDYHEVGLTSTCDEVDGATQVTAVPDDGGLNLVFNVGDDDPAIYHLDKAHPAKYNQMGFNRFLDRIFHQLPESITTRQVLMPTSTYDKLESYNPYNASDMEHDCTYWYGDRGVWEHVYSEHTKAGIPADGYRKALHVARLMMANPDKTLLSDGMGPEMD